MQKKTSEQIFTKLLRVDLLTVELIFNAATFNHVVSMKKRSERRKHCALAVVRRSQKISPRRTSPSRGRRTAKI